MQGTGESVSNRKRVLLLEDHDHSREPLAELLRRSGFDVSAYDRCEPAEPHLAACDIDIALLDVRMPGRCGDDFGRELRARCPKTMIVFVTGEAMVDPLHHAVPDCFVMRKPIDVAVLLELLAWFTSDGGCGSPTRKETDDRARPGKM
jgi:two-component system, cell cycle sensor histidine kinase and response regulator CckA